MAQRKAECSFDGTMTVKMEKFSQKLSKTLLLRQARLSPSGLPNRVYQHLRCVFSACEREDYCCDSIGRFLKLLGDIGFPVDRISILRHGRLFWLNLLKHYRTATQGRVCCALVKLGFSHKHTCQVIIASGFALQGKDRDCTSGICFGLNDQIKALLEP
jgi:hypothetical protein